jgi:hypothetical protein
MAEFIVVLILLALWFAAEMKTSRPDGTWLKDTPKFRQMMFHLMPTANVSYVLFDSYVEVDDLLEYLEKAREKFDVDLTHCAVAAYAIGFMEVPKMNRFVAGRRLYQRNGVHITFSMKRKQLDRKSDVVLQKLQCFEHETFREFTERVNESINYQRSGEETYTDKELDLFTSMPRPLLAITMKAAKLLNYYNLLPESFIENDDMFTSGVLANLGSLKMGAGYHHLYEWGTCPLFMMLGQVEEQPVVRDGEITTRKILPIRYNYDERIDDGLNARFGIESVKRALENPYKYFGCLEDDGSDARPMLPEEEQ